MLSISRRRASMLDLAVENAGGQVWVEMVRDKYPRDFFNAWAKGIVREDEKPAGQSIEDVLDAIDAKKAIPARATIVATDAQFSEVVDGSDDDS